jgi:hypothetical protein
VKNPYTVLHEKEQQLVRVRAEVRALLTVIPLLADSAPSWSEVKLLLTSKQGIEQRTKRLAVERTSHSWRPEQQP